MTPLVPTSHNPIDSDMSLSVAYPQISDGLTGGWDERTGGNLTMSVND